MIKLLCCIGILMTASLSGQTLLWPTPNTAFLEKKDLDSWVQPTASGEVASGLFGCVRNDGNRFHEALDIKPILPRRNGEATDPIFAVYPGRVVHVNKVAGRSSYGRYVVVEHTDLKPAIYTLYAHLATIDNRITVGSNVAAGAVLGIMGRSAGGYGIPKSRAHLHFEIGLRLSDRFQAWYDRQEFGSENDHGNYNGMNLVGWDPLPFYQINRDQGPMGPFEYLNQLEPGFVVRIRTARIPDFVRRYPELVIPGVGDSGQSGWEIRLTAWGLPLTFRAIGEDELVGLPEREVFQIVSINPEQLETFACRSMVRQVGSTYVLGSGGESTMAILFQP